MSDESASAPADVSPGDKIAGYRLEEQIGQGGMAVVYRAHDERLDRQVALKLLAPALAADTAFRTRFIRESRAAAAVDHPNIIPVYDAGDAGGCLFISMRYVQGGDVRSLLGDARPLAPARAWHIISQVAAALDAAHAHGLVHRDVKPANMLLDASGRTSTGTGADAAAEPHDHVYLSDFGISKRTLASNLTSTGQFLGTLDYIAPEQIEGHAIDGRADQYSLACAAFELLCGAPPFRRSTGLAVISAHLTEQPPSLAARRTELARGWMPCWRRRWRSPPASVTPPASSSPRTSAAGSGWLPARRRRCSRRTPASRTPSPGPRRNSPSRTAAPAEPAPAAPVDPAPAAPAGPGGPVPFDPSTMPAGQQGAQSGEARATGQPAAWAQQPRQTWPDQPGGGYGGGQYPPQQQFQQPTGQNVPGWQQGPPPARKSRGLLVGIGAGVLVVAVGAGVGAVIYAGQNKVPPPHGHGNEPARVVPGRVVPGQVGARSGHGDQQPARHEPGHQGHAAAGRQRHPGQLLDADARSARLRRGDHQDRRRPAPE